MKNKYIFEEGGAKIDIGQFTCVSKVYLGRVACFRLAKN